MRDESLVPWFAGFYEGEGSICLTKPTKRGGRYLRMSIGSTDRDVLEHVELHFGGTVRGPYTTVTPRGAEGKLMYHWALTRTEQVRTLANQIRPYLSSRRCADIDRATAAQVYAHKPSVEERFEALVEIHPSGCHLWKGHIDAFGFGTWTVTPSQRVQAHRWAIGLRDGVAPPRVRNTCGSKHCVRPDHWKPDRKQVAA